VWIITYLYNGKSFQVIANGVTGKIKGKYPLSWVKILLAAMCVIIATVLIISAIGVDNAAEATHFFMTTQGN
jgi:uncharacterized membrane protein YozB (DUF420 family)